FTAVCGGVCVGFAFSAETQQVRSDGPPFVLTVRVVFVPQGRHVVAGLHRLRIDDPLGDVVDGAVKHRGTDGVAEAKVGEVGVGRVSTGVSGDRVAADAALLHKELAA